MSEIFKPSLGLVVPPESIEFIIYTWFINFQIVGLLGFF